ncbi:hypothetical protein HYU93_00990 [Candidatus Daviesbacteria bacterium]|nr:hypothetical protein [Candidatus Daviesbacteria bacterium]
MADSDYDKIAKLFKDRVRDLKDVVELIKHKVDNIQVFQDASSENIHLMKEQQSLMNEKLDNLEQNVKKIQENVDAARGDIESLHMDVKGIREKESLFHSRNKREIDEIKTHLDIPLIPDTPQI